MIANIWITGASRGIGKAIMLSLASHFKREDKIVRFIFNSRHHDDNVCSLCRYLSENNIPFHYMTGNIGCSKDRTRMLAEIHSLFGTVDLLINNAAISYIGLTQDMTENDISEMICINLESVLSLSSQIIPDLLKSNFPHRGILNISSVWGNAGASCETVYSATKGGINSFTKALGKELAPSSIPVNTIACGLIDTEMNHTLSKEDLDSLCDEIPAGRMGKPEEVGELAWLLIHAPSYLTGQIITIDGGWI